MNITSRRQKCPPTYCISAYRIYQEKVILTLEKKLYNVNILHQQVPLPVPCVNFTQITIKLISI